MKIDVIDSYSDLNLLLRMNYPNEKDNTFIDVGAFRGGFSVAFARRGWRVIAFEPETTNFKMLSRRVKGFPDVTCIQKAVTDSTRERVTIYINKKHPTRNSLKPISENHCYSEMVKSTRLDDELSNHDIEDVTVLKIDIEGADFSALKGFNFSNHHPLIVMVEFHDQRTKTHFGYTHHDIVAFMNGYDYQAFILEIGLRQILDFTYQVGTTPYKLIQIARYPLDHEPEMGNIVFIERTKVEEYEKLFQSYLDDLDKFKYLRLPFQMIRMVLMKIPIAKRTYYMFRRLAAKLT